MLFFSSKYIWRYISLSKACSFSSQKSVNLFDGTYPIYASSIVSDKLKNDSKVYSADSFYGILKNVYIEPKYFSVLTNSITIVKESQFYDWQRLSIKETIYRLFISKRQKTIDEAVVFDSFIGLNYFHFYNDVFPIIYYIYSYKLEDKPVLIGRKLFSTSWFQYFLSTPLFSKIKWQIVNSDDYYKVKLLHLIRPEPYSIKHIISIHKTAAKNEAREKGLRLFITRNENENRHIVTMNLLIPHLLKLGFVIVDLTVMSIQEQISIFRRSEVVAGPHGAGLTNLLFSDNTSLKIIEIFPENFISAHYYWMSSVLGFKYAAFAGGALKLQAHGVTGFEVDPEKLSKFIEEFLD